MRIRTVLHKGLRRFIAHDDASRLQPALVEKLRRMISFLQDMAVKMNCGPWRDGKPINSPAVAVAREAWL